MRFDERLVETLDPKFAQAFQDMAATQSIIKTRQNDLQPFYSEHTLASPGLESAILRDHGRKLVLDLLESCKG
jgi:hypothetical protein